MSLRRFQLAPLGLAALLLSGCGSPSPPSERQGNASSQEVETPAEFFQMRDDESLGAWSARTRAVTAHWRENWAKLVQGRPGETDEFVDTLVQASGEVVERQPGRWRVTTFSGVECVVLLVGEQPDVTVAANETPIATFAGMVQSINGERNQVIVQDCAVMSVVSKRVWDELQAGKETLSGPQRGRNNKAQGRAAHPGTGEAATIQTPKGFYHWGRPRKTPSGFPTRSDSSLPRVRFATLALPCNRVAVGA